MPDISLLPEELRKKEGQLTKTPAPQAGSNGDLRFSMPSAQQEDIEIIEVDEGELDQVLASEPPLSRLAFKVQDFVQGLMAKLRQPKKEVPPAKTPPQFFTPPAAKPAATGTPSAATPKISGLPPVATPAAGAAAATVPPKPATPSAGGAASTPTLSPSTAGVTPGMLGKELLDAVVDKPKAAAAPAPVIKPIVATPAAAAVDANGVPRRVRVIKRVRKPVNVSFVSNEAALLSQVDVPKRRFTMITTFLVFALLFGASYAYLMFSRQSALDSLAVVKSQIDDVHHKFADREKTWRAYKDLEPQLKALNVLLDKHISQTALLGRIERVTLPAVSYDTLNLDEKGKVSLSVTTDSYETAARQVLAFQQASFVSKVEANSYTAEYNVETSGVIPESVKFQIALILNPSAFVVPTSTEPLTAYAP